MIPEFRCTTVEDLYLHAEQFAHELGFPHFGFVAEMRENLPGGGPDLRLLTNNPPAWAHSLQRAVSESMPHHLVRHASLHLPAVGWSVLGHLVGHIIIDDLTRQHVRDIGSWGLQAGALCPVAAPEIEWGALAFFSPHPMNYEQLHDVVPALPSLRESLRLLVPADRPPPRRWQPPATDQARS
ncbi:MAG: autoinducer binding domain-containing protein [Chiayiivirga sp.]|jgi:hypothetical protein|nr:autoinducer binding domain-containing protein [Chiayiivirga sp.]